tara:strand:+ start:169 stop:360 length:192 start_codon:yes stop_codon:yes gene_type:complete
MEGRFKNVLESIILVAILLSIYWLLGFIINKLFNKEIRTEKGYLACIIGGFILKYFLITLLKG